jgi:hypothetical protein
LNSVAKDSIILPVLSRSLYVGITITTFAMFSILIKQQ